MFDLSKPLYHGTTSFYANGIKENMLNPSKWKPGCDFGAGFYLTNDLDQAKEWAIKAVRRCIGTTPVVLCFKVPNPNGLSNTILTIHKFDQADYAWAEFILEHRLYAKEGTDPCGSQHAELIYGPMADNKTGQIISDLKRDPSFIGVQKGDEQWTQKVKWFYNKVTVAPSGELEILGTQCAISNSELSKWFEPCIGIQYDFKKEVWSHVH